MIVRTAVFPSWHIFSISVASPGIWERYCNDYPNHCIYWWHVVLLLHHPVYRNVTVMIIRTTVFTRDIYAVWLLHHPVYRNVTAMIIRTTVFIHDLCMWYYYYVAAGVKFSETLFSFVLFSITLCLYSCFFIWFMVRWVWWLCLK
jgi:hypothetical protein